MQCDIDFDGLFRFKETPVRFEEIVFGAGKFELYDWSVTLK